MLVGHDEGAENLYVSIPHGGPLYVPNMVGPVTSVSQFETSVYQELQSLKDELFTDSSDTWDHEILVDELKIIREDELVEKAFEEAFKVAELTVDVSQDREEHLSARPSDGKAVPHTDASSQNSERDIQAIFPTSYACLENSEKDTQAIVLSETSNRLPLNACNSKKSNKISSRKRKHRNSRKNNFDESYMAKVEELARIKQKQEDDKASVRLHSFNGGCRSHECGTITENGDKIRSLKSASVSTKVKSSNSCDNIPVDFPETILCFEVYHNRKNWMKTQEFLVLGRQLLTEAKDKIYCLTDEVMKKAGHYNPSGYFLVEELFYNDMREYTSIDYSQPILDWVENSKSDALEKWEHILTAGVKKKDHKEALLDSGKKQPLPRFKAFNMEHTRFCDIKFRLGAGYLYCHQGDCKHVIIIRDMRLIHPEDVHNQAAYPLIAFQMKFRYAKCSVCKIYRAQKITVDDKWAPFNPCYCCDICYYMLHYANGSLLYSDFSVYDYIHD